MSDQPNLGGDPDYRPWHEASDPHLHWTPADDTPPVEPERSSINWPKVVAYAIVCGVVAAILIPVLIVLISMVPK